MLALAACDDGPHLMPVDLAIPAMDMTEPVDMTKPVDMVELPPPACTSPLPGIYTEYLQYTYVPVNGPGSPATVTYGAPVTVRNDGAFDRPKGGFQSPNVFHCTFDAPDKTTCMAQCCPGQPSSPTLYFDSGGWTMWTSGSCAFQTTLAAQYIATVTAIDGIFLR